MNYIKSYEELISSLTDEDVIELEKMEKLSFPEGMPYLDKLKIEYSRIMGFVYDNMSNESMYDSVSIDEINGSIMNINSLIMNNDMDQAAAEIVMLQLSLGLDIRLGSTLIKLINDGLDLDNINRKRKK